MKTQITGYPSTASTRMLMAIDGRTRTSSSIARAVGCTCSHTNKLAQDLRDDGLVEFIEVKCNQRDKPMALTKKGMKIKEILIKLNEAYNE